MAREVFVNKNPKTLGSAIASTGATSMVLSDVTNLPTYGNVRALIDNEIVIAILTGSTTVTISRGADGTTAATHASGATVNFILTAGTLNQNRKENSAIGTYSLRPTPGFEGATWRDTDSPTFARDNGTTWDTFYAGRLVTPIDVSGMSKFVSANPALGTPSVGTRSYGALTYVSYNAANAGAHTAGFIGIPRNVSSTVDWTVILGFESNANDGSDFICGLGFYDHTTGGLAIWGVGNPGDSETLQTYNTSNSGSPSTSFNSSVFNRTNGCVTRFKYWRAQYIHAQSTSNIYLSTSIDGYNWTISNSPTYSTLNVSSLDYVGIGFRDYTSVLGYNNPGMSIYHWSYTEP